jgi:hypothetical protein
VLRQDYFAGFRSVLPQGIGPKGLDAPGHLGSGLGKPGPHGRRHIIHEDTLLAQADFLQYLLEIFYSSFGVQITFQVMAVAFQSTGHHHAVYAPLKGV